MTNIDPRPYPNCDCEKIADTYYCDADHSSPDATIAPDAPPKRSPLAFLDDDPRWD